MDNRVFSRVNVDVPSCFYITFGDYSCLDISGTIHNISESGVQIRISSDAYSKMVERLTVGDVIGFQALDEYNVVNDKRVDIFDGDAEVVWVDSNSKEILFGCRVNNINSNYLSYVKNKKLSLYFSGQHDISIAK